MDTVKLSTIPRVIKIKDENRIYIRLFFIVDNTLKQLDRYIIQLMIRMMNNSTNKWTTMKEFNNVLDNNYIISYRINVGTFVNKKGIMFNMTIPKEGIIDEFSYDKAFSVLHELIYNPFQEDNHFNKERFTWEKEIMLNNVKDEYSSLYEESYEEFNNFIDENEEHFLRRKTIRRLIEEADEYNTYDYYLKNIKNNKFVTYIFGGIDKEEDILNSFNKYFKQDENNWRVKVKKTHFYPYIDSKNKTIITKYQQSALDQCYQIKDIKKSDLDKLDMLGFFLNSRENNLLFNALRVKNNLVYETHLDIDDKYGFMKIEVLMDKKDLDIIRELIKETIYSVKDRNVFEKCKERLLVSLKYDHLYHLDDPTYEIYEYMKKEIKYADTYKYMCNAMKRIKYEDMLDFLNRLHLGKELFLEGGNDGKNN